MTPPEMIERVAAYRGVLASRLRGPLRTSLFVVPRHEAMWILREATELSYPAIGRLFGGRDHSTVIAACRKVEARMLVRPSYREELLSLVRPVRVERLPCANVSCSGCIPSVPVEREAA